jgi:aspartyl-tRNA(Asn)/glutamyl-tRNA(Gln) amidotransferase subunit A
VPRYTDEAGRGVAGMTFGIPDEYFAPGMDPEVEAAVRAAIAQVEALGGKTVRVALPHSKYAVATYYIVATAEAASNLARYDGVRYGHRAALPPKATLLDVYKTSRGEGFGPEVKRRIMLGTYALRSGYYDAYYKRAQQVRALIKQDFDRAFASCDVILTPATPTAAFRLGEKAKDPLAMYLADIYTISCNLAGIAGLSLPCGFTASGLPIGLQLLAPALGEPALFRAAYAYEAATPWHTRRPALAEVRS